MRIACIHIPQYALQCATRLDPSLRGAAIAMASAGEPWIDTTRGASALHAPVIVACSRAAWALGVRLGMTATAARTTAPDVSVVSVDAASERETVRAIADGVLGLTAIVDVGGRVGAGGAHLAMYAEVPQKTRGSTFGERVIERLSQLGLTGRVGIADDRFTAWVAAAYGSEGARSHDDPGAVTMVPRGGSAAFLAPRPLSLLAISSEVQHMLEALGVRTLGEFASLPAPSVARPLEADYRALARGESGSHLRPYAPEAAIREELVVAAGTVLDSTEAVGGPTAIALVARRIALRLEGRARGAARVELSAIAGTHGNVIAAITPDLAELGRLQGGLAAVQAELPSYIEPRTTPSISSAEELARAFAPILDAIPANAAAAAWRLRVTVVGESITTMNELDLAVTTELAMPVRTQEAVVLAAPVVMNRAVGSSRAVASSSGSGAVRLQPGATSSALGTQPHRVAEPHVPRSTHNLTVRAANANGASDVANSNHYGAGELNTSTPGAADPLAVVLSTSGALFALSPNEPERAAREHRRTRRGKQRRSRSMTAPVQARLFDRRG
jgi:hypothetical protein